jgi:hypothetical protein
MDASWLFSSINPTTKQAAFGIHRSHSKCRTPLRNPDVSKALAFFKDLSRFTSALQYTLSASLIKVDRLNRLDDLDYSAANGDDIFVPIVSLFDADRDNSATPGGTSKGKSSVAFPGSPPPPLLSLDDINIFLDVQLRSIDAKKKVLNDTFPNAAATSEMDILTELEAAEAAAATTEIKSLVSNNEAIILAGCTHASGVALATVDGLYYIEDMLYKQLLSAIGKQLTADDFSEYMDFHYSRIFKPQYAPQPFCHAVRRSGHMPEGTISIESNPGTPANTIMRHIKEGAPMTFPINAATKISFGGDRFLHALLDTQFGGSRYANNPPPSPSELTLVAKARQFSSYLLLVGKIGGSDSFQPQHGIILQNKDELKIPLLLETMPTPKEFRDAIESMSPEQQRFCKAFRSMQLEGSVFAVCVIQLKPQLETLLKLEPDSLTKEIRLTQDLLSLFIDYQIPSDLLAYGGPPVTEASVKLVAVKGHVANVLAMIQEERDKDVALAKQQAEEAKARAEAAQYEEEARGYDDDVRPLKSHEPRRMMLARTEVEMMSAPARMSEAFFGASANILPPPAAAPFGGFGGASAPIRAPPAAASSSSDAAAPATSPTVSESDSFTQITSADLDTEDFTQVPRALDSKFEALDTDSALKPTKVKCAGDWEKLEQPSILGKPSVRYIDEDKQASEKTRCFDLLDAISQSGAITIENASLHVVVAATHCFGQSLIDTVIQENANPIEKCERSALIVASVVHGESAGNMIAGEQEVARIKEQNGNLFAQEE